MYLSVYLFMYFFKSPPAPKRPHIFYFKVRCEIITVFLINKECLKNVLAEKHTLKIKVHSYLADHTVPRSRIIGRVVFALQARENNTSGVLTQEDPDTLV